MINLKNKFALITGGSRGIGEACVRLFSKAGAIVGFTFKAGKKSADRVVEELSTKSKVKAFRVDLLNEKEIKDTVSSFEDQTTSEMSDNTKHVLSEGIRTADL